MKFAILDYIPQKYYFSQCFQPPIFKLTDFVKEFLSSLHCSEILLCAGIAAGGAFYRCESLWYCPVLGMLIPKWLKYYLIVRLKWRKVAKSEEKDVKSAREKFAESVAVFWGGVSLFFRGDFWALKGGFCDSWSVFVCGLTPWVCSMMRENWLWLFGEGIFAYFR